MATVSTKEIKNRIRSMESTKQITRAMEMVAASKLRHAQTKASDARPYFEILLGTIKDIVCSGQGAQSPYLTQRPVKRTAFPAREARGAGAGVLVRALSFSISSVPGASVFSPRAESTLSQNL